MDNRTRIIALILLWVMMACIVPMIKIRFDDRHEYKIPLRPLWQHSLIGLFWPVTLILMGFYKIGTLGYLENVKLYERQQIRISLNCRFQPAENLPLNISPLAYPDKDKDKDQSPSSI